MVTRNDVAKRANVSPAVVSYVLNNSNYVSKEKRAAVLEAIRELNYIPNQNARNLRKGRSRMIAVIRGSQLNDTFNDVLHYMEKTASEGGYQIASVTVLKTEDYLATDDFIETLISRHYDAVFAANSSLTEKQLTRLSQYTKVVLYTSRDYAALSPKVSRIMPDYRKGVYEAVSRLLDLGHTRISILPNIGYPMAQFSPINHRYAGYISALSERGIEPDLRYVPPQLTSLAEVNSAVRNMFNPLITPVPPTAICTDESYVLAEVLKILGKLGKRVPEDVSLFGFSYSFISTITSPPLTCMGYSHSHLADLTMRVIHDMIHGGEAREEYIPLTYYGGGSIAPPPKARAGRKG